MGLYSALNASVSGMAAQTSKLSAISQNISNTSTTGYKDVEAQVEDVVSSADSTSFNGAGATTTYAYLNSVQGSYTTTSSSTDLAIDGNGYFVVEDSSGAKYLTRDGSFTADSSGNLVNDAGYTLMGFPAGYTGTEDLDNMVAVNVNGSSSSPSPTTTATLSANLPSTATAATGDLPSSNASDATYTDKTSITTYDDLGTSDTLDVYYTKTGDNTWEMSVYNDADSTDGGFPYSSSALTTETLTFDPTTGDLSSVTDSSGNTVSSSAVSVTLPGESGQTFDLDISGMTQNASSFDVTTATADGSAASAATGTVDVSSDGTISAVYADGSESAIYTIALATVPSQDSLTPISGNVWQLNSAAGTVSLSTPGSSGTGTIKSDTLESSTDDLATQLTDMISAQNGYEANSKVFQTATTLLEDLVNLIK